MIVITGAAGFIGSCLIREFNNKGFDNLIIVDDFSKIEKINNYKEKKYFEKVERENFVLWAESNYKKIDFIFHIGARTDTAEFNVEIFNKLNLNYSKSIWDLCSKYSIPLVYASSAATYGMGEHGYNDNHDIIKSLKPLNPYGESKNDFDKWVIKQEKTPPFWAGLKFFNVYGPNEYHKNRMASVVFHGYNQILKTNKIKLFKSHNPEYKDGMQLRDFIYVKDLAKVCMYLYESKPSSGIYNLGTGKARAFYDLALNTFKALDIEPNIEFIDTPLDIRDKYQYFTEANMSKLINSGYTEKFYTLEEGIFDYVKNYLIKNKYF